MSPSAKFSLYESHPESALEFLIVRLGAMGDVIHALPAAASLKRSFPGCLVSWVVSPAWAALLDGNPVIDRMILFDRKEIAGWRPAVQQLRAQTFHAVLDLQGLIKSALVARVARSENVIGFSSSQARESLAPMFYNTPVQTKSAHVVDQNLELVRAAGAAEIVQDFPLPPGSPDGLLPMDGFILACPFAGWRSKQWPLDYFAETALLLKKALGLPLVLNGPPSSAHELAAVPGVIVHTGSVAGLIDATRRATAVIGIDSGPVHLAAALGKPGVAIFGPTDPARNGPYGGSITVLRSPQAVTTYKRHSVIDPAMGALTPQAVMDALLAKLAFSK